MVKTVAYDDFIKEYRGLTRQIRALSEDCIEVYEMPSWGNPEVTVELGINWSACGTKSLEETEGFVATLQTAIQMVKAFKYNGYKIVDG